MNSHKGSCELGLSRKSRSGEEEEEEDRLSHLPEPILHHILSFLDTKSAVQTCVLSRLWRCAWKGVPVLDLSFRSFQQYPTFRRFVSNALSLRYNLNLRKVTYLNEDQHHDVYSGDVSMSVEVIQYALTHDAQHLVIKLENFGKLNGSDRFSNLFGTILNCNLKTLELRYACIDSGLGSCGFQLLTTLSLRLCSLASDQHEDFFSSFPSLKNLVLIRCKRVDDNGLKISGAQLLSLKLEYMKCFKMEIFAPRLKFFSLLHKLESLSSIKLSIPSLDHAAILLDDWYNNAGEYKVRVAQRLIPLFQGLNNATSLTLDLRSIEVLSNISVLLAEQPSPFTRLKSLIVTTYSEQDSVPNELVNYFLKGSSSLNPNVEFVRSNFF
ncbi:unnamed protein product [Linum tenue]|uniref:F-box domain-containing protein n=1 Tax=Linum tenue TaxID=586396 RepID=A0AAV0JTW9_9ROSI|nr:unnamed protein product [Linum tenue]